MSRFGSLRIIVNLVAFALLGLALTAWALTTVIHLDRFERPYVVTADFATSPGLSPRFEVTYLGHNIGAIRSVDLVDGHVSVELAIDRDVAVPAAVDASVRRKSAVGEPYVDLAPSPGTDPDAGPRLAGGDLIPLDRTMVPLAYQELFSAADRLLAAVEPDDVETLLAELAEAVEGRSESLRTILTGADQLTAELVENADLLDAFLTDVSLITSTLAEHRGALASGIDDVAAVSETLARSQAALETVLTSAPGFGEALADVLDESAADLGCTIDALGSVGTRLDAATLASLAEVIALSPQFDFVLDGLTRPPVGLGGYLFVGSGNEAPLPMFDTPLPAPVVPAVAACGGGPMTSPASGAPSGTAPPGTSGTETDDSSPLIVEPGQSGQGGQDVDEASSTSDVGGGFDAGPWPWVLLAALAIAAVGATARRWWPVLRGAGDSGGD